MILLIGYNQFTFFLAKGLLSKGAAVSLLITSAAMEQAKNNRLFSLGLEWHAFPTFDGEDCLNFVKNMSPAHIVVAGCTEKISDKLIGLSKGYALNIHPSLLPRYRGTDPSYWIVRNGETVSGITAHQLTQVWDGGDIALQLQFKVSQTDTLASYLDTLYQAMLVFAGYLYPHLEKNDLEFTPQDEASAFYIYAAKDADFVIDFKQPADTVLAQIRAANPYWPCVAKLSDATFTIREAAVTPVKSTVPGALKMTETEIRIGTADVDISVSVLFDVKLGFISAQRFLARLSNT